MTKKIGFWIILGVVTALPSSDANSQYRDGAVRTARWLQATAISDRDGVVWHADPTDPKTLTTSLYAGTPGPILFLLETARSTGDATYLATAHRAADALVAAIPTQKEPGLYAGLAGTGFTLGEAYLVTRDDRYRTAALECVKRLQDTATTIGRGAQWNETTDYRLYQTTRDAMWLTWTQKAARAAVASGAPQKVVTPGEWDNVSVCCGVTGQAQFFLDMYEVTKAQPYLDLARKASDLLVAKATTDEQGMRWVQAETRVKPEVRVAQTGLMQGASGIGLWLLHFDDYLQKKRGAVITLPDNPFTY